MTAVPGRSLRHASYASDGLEYVDMYVRDELGLGVGRFFGGGGCCVLFHLFCLFACVVCVFLSIELDMSALHRRMLELSLDRSVLERTTRNPKDPSRSDCYVL